MKTERRAVRFPRRKTSSGCLVVAASASDTLQPNTEHACVQRARRRIHLGRRDGGAFLNIQDIGCSELIDRMLERWVPVHSLERQAYETRCTARKTLAIGLFSGFSWALLTYSIVTLQYFNIMIEIKSYSLIIAACSGSTTRFL
jgi:hypothetical protein